MDAPPTTQDDTHPSPTTSERSSVPRASTWLVWALFACSAGLLVGVVHLGHELRVPGVFAVDGLAALLWTVVAFFSGIVQSYARRYMAGDARLDGFYVRVLGFTLVVMAMAAADHIVLFAACWLAMGLLMASLIGHERGWEQANAAAANARRYFLASSGLLAAGLSVLAWTTGTASISGILGNVEAVGTLGLLAALLLLGAAMVQSALVPFHGWLLSSMTAPTPASALMHAGFVNAGGVLLTRFAPLFAGRETVLAVVVLVGAASALLGQALLLVQPDVKRTLGASTVAQMGFMILQCGLGFFAAAITHLALHGFYKAYLFLSSGENVERAAPKEKNDGMALSRLALSVVTALGGGALFVALTGKGASMDSGAVLALVVVLTTLHATRDVLQRPTLTPTLGIAAVPVVAFLAIGAYSLLFNAVSAAMADVPMATAPTELTGVHLGVAAAFVVAYLATELGWHRSSERLYVALLNLAQPSPTTVLTRKENYDD